MASVCAGYIGPADASILPIDTDFTWPAIDARKFEEQKRLLRTLDFDVLNQTPDELLVFVLEVMRELNVFTKLNASEERFRKFLVAVRAGYQKNPYHNWFHAVDVFQTVFALLSMSGQLGENSRFSDLHKFALLCAALCHDIDHPGVNNVFLIQNKSELALLYNDQSVLENHHCARCFFLLQRPELNFISNFSKADYSEFRRILTSCVLATDMGRHKEFVDKITALASGGEPARTPENDLVLMQFFLKCADISNVVKPFQTAKKWTVRVTTEFYCQGDREKYYGLDVTPMCDPTKGTRTGSQIGFIDFVALNAFRPMVTLFPGLSPCIDNATANRDIWREYNDERLLQECPVPLPDP